MGLFDKFAQSSKDAFKGYDKIKTTEKMNTDQLFEIIKDGTYSMGKPEITGSGIMRAIRFPPVNKYYLQVSVSGTTIMIVKAYNGVGGLAKEALGDAVTGGWYDIVNKENIDSNRGTREVGAEISRLLEEKGLLKK